MQNMLNLVTKKKLENAKILIISWAFKNSFQPDGSYHDKYFNENSKNLPNRD